MRNYQLFVSGILAVSLCCGLSACKKQQADDASATVQAPETVKKSPKDWNKDAVNGLLAYVPADTAFVFATTRQFNMNSPVIKDMMARSGKMMTKMQNIEAAVKKFAETDPDLNALANSFQFGVQFLPLYTDFQKNAPDFGLNPINYDAVAYLDGNHFVIKGTVDDSAKFKAKLSPAIDLLVKVLGNEGITIEKQDTDTRTVYTLKETITRDDILGTPEDARQNSPDTTIKLIVNYGEDDITAVVSFDSKSEIDIDRILKPAATPITKEKLGIVDETTMALGYIDNAIAVKKILAAPASREIINDFLAMDLTEECASEISELVAKYPRMNLVQRIVGDKEFHFDSTIVFSDKAELKNLQSLQVSHQDVTDNRTQVSIGLNFDLSKAIDLLTAKVNASADTMYKCQTFGDFRNDMFDLMENLKTPELQLYKDSVMTLTGVNLGIHYMDFSKFGEGEIKFDGIFNIAAKQIGNVVSQLAPLMSGAFPQLSQIKANAEKPLEYDLTEYVPGQKFNIYMTDTNFMVASPSYDIMAMAKKAPKNEKSFLEITWNMDFYKQIVQSSANSAPDQKDLFALVASMYDDLNGSFVTTVSTNAEGVTCNSVFTLK